MIKCRKHASDLRKIIISLLLILAFPTVFAYEQIPITLSGEMDKVVFDGKWSSPLEWKKSSFNQYDFEHKESIILRSAHQDDFVYFLVDSVSDDEINNGADKAMICFDTNNDKTVIPNSDDYCFLSVLGSSEYFVFQGNPNNSSDNYFKKISLPKDYVGIGSASDDNDKYILIPHPSYEFKIPTDTIGRKSVYGFYFAVYDANTTKTYTYPENVTSSELFSSPAKWGEIYSPDKSLPEFGFPMIVMVFTLGLLIFYNKVFRIKR